MRCRHCGFAIYWTRAGYRHIANAQTGRTPCNGMVAEPMPKKKKDED